MQIVFTTFNARYSHTSLSLRCLRANLGVLHDLSAMMEFDIALSPLAAAEKLLTANPQIILFSVYIWNRTVIYETALILKKIRPEIKIIIGGPEVSYEYGDTLIIRLADHLICGEGESVIEEICRTLLDDVRPDRLEACDTVPQASCLPCSSVPQASSLPKVILSPPADLGTVALPYDEYTDEDIANRRIYVETSRGCPSKCQYCLSSLENGIRFFPTEKLFPMFGKLIDRGARIFKFIDRSFNANPAHAAEILHFFLKNHCDGMMLHLEWEPHLLPPDLLQILREAPPGFIQLEVGVQTFTPAVAARIERHLDTEKIEQNIHTLSSLNSIHLHADLIAGLPGETMNTLTASFDRLHACGPDEIQLGILKKLRGAPIAQHDIEWQMVYNSSPPYDVLQTSTLNFPELQSIRRFARFWDIIVNNGRFPRTAPLIWEKQPSIFDAFMQWSNWLYEKTRATAGFTPGRLGRLLNRFLIKQRGLDEKSVSDTIEKDLTTVSGGTKGMERQTRK